MRSKKKTKVCLTEWEVGCRSIDLLEKRIKINVDKDLGTIEFSLDTEGIAKKIEQEGIEAFLETCENGMTYIELTDTGLVFRSRTNNCRHGMVNRNIHIAFEHLDMYMQGNVECLKARAKQWHDWIDSRVSYLLELYQEE